MNDIQIPWKRITRGLPKGRKHANDRCPTIEEITRIVEYPDRRIKALLFVPCFRLAFGLALRRLFDGKTYRICEIVAAKIIIYAEDEEEYFSFS